MRTPSASYRPRPARAARGLLAAAVAASVVCGSLLAPAWAQPTTPGQDGDVLAHYEFDALAGGVAAGTVVADSSDSANDATVRGAGATVVDGDLFLPGGGNGSGAAYVELPRGMFDGHDTLTISAWLKNETASGNYAAMFFGSSQSLPSQYWLLNPRNGQGRFKSVVTDGVSTGSPWTTEAGISPSNAARGVQGPLTDDSWTLYTTVIEPGRITGYLDGRPAGTVATTRTVSQFGTDLVGYLGRSSYADPFYDGGIREVEVLTRALTDAEVVADYYGGVDDATVDAALAADAEALDLGPSTVLDDVELPSVGASGSVVAWATDRPDVIAVDGTLTRPEQDATVVLTATLTLAGRTATRDLVLTVPAADPQADLERAAEGLVLPAVLASGEALPQPAGGALVAWSVTEGLSVVDGALVATGAGGTSGSVTAGLTLPGTDARTTKTFEVTVLAADGARWLLGYERAPLATTVYSAKLAHSLHLALGDTPQDVRALNENHGVLFAAAAPLGLDRVETRTLRDPWVFRAADGTFAVVATRALGDGTPDPATAGQVLVFTSDDLLSFRHVGLLDLGVEGQVRRPRAVYDTAAEVYRLTWQDASGRSYRTSDADLAAGVADGPLQVGGLTLPGVDVTTGITGARPSTLLPVTVAEAQALQVRFGRTRNTAVDVPDVTLEVGGTLDADAVEAALTYSDGSTATRAVDWDADDLAAVDTDVPGTYTVEGTVRQRSYPRPFVVAEADPSIIRYGDSYLFISTDDRNVVGARTMYLRQADTVEGLRTAPDVPVASTGVAGIAGCFWAPELHVVGGRLYVYFAPCIGAASWQRVQAHVMELEGDDPSDPDAWGTPRPVLQADGSPLQRDAAHPGISLDMTYYEHDGSHYVSWSQRYTSPSLGDAELWVATIDPSDPWRLTSEPAKLVTSEYGWDTNTSNVAEGAYFIEHEGTVYMTYSGSNVDSTYVMGLLTAPSGSDLADPDVWTKWDYPVLKTDRSINEIGPGHSMFSHDEDGVLVLVYHAKATDSGLRDTYVRRVHWAADGQPVLDMSLDEEVAPDNRRVSTTVTVTAAPTAPATTVEAATRCVAGRVVEVVQVGNDSDGPLTLTVSSPHGSRTVAVQPDGASSVALSTRRASVPAGEVTVTADGAGVGAVTAGYAARSCGTA